MVIAVSLAVIGGDDDVGVVVQHAGLLHPAQQPPDVVILMGDFGVVKIVDDLLLPILEGRLVRACPRGGIGVEAADEAHACLSFRSPRAILSSASCGGW